MKEKYKTIKEVAANNLCTGCGTCVGMCPSCAVAMIRDKARGIFVPELSEEKCTHCGTCIEVCPGYSLDFRKVVSRIFGKEPEDTLIGNYRNLYTGHATDYDVRYNSASGGLVTALLIFALEKGVIDGALITRMKKDSPLQPDSIIARTRDEILSGMGSKYCPVPANIALKQILKEHGKYAVVGLPCHIQGIRKAEMLDRKLYSRIVLHIGLFCSCNRNFWGTEYLFWKLGIKKEDVVDMAYRGKGWLGGMTIKLKDGRKKFCSYLTYNHMWRSFFVPIRCTLCNDQFSELADISCGDIWLPEFMTDKIGTSALISRSKIVDRILYRATSCGRIKLRNVSRDKIVESQKDSLLFKKKLIGARISLFRMLGRDTPLYDRNPTKPRLPDFFLSTSPYLQICLSSRRYLWPLLSLFSVLFEKIERISSLLSK